jgi:hypothetical protein
MSDVRKAIKKIRGIPTKPLEVTDPVDIRLALAAGEIHMHDQYQGQVEIIRDRNFEKAKEARARNIEMRQRERERQEQIAEDRLKNLKKARKALERKRNAESP